MSTTRNGKIARLPRAVRNQLDLHLDNGMEAEPILEWVNGLPETQVVLGDKFEGKPINAQNLSEWRQGGHQNWLRNQQRIELARLLAEQAQDLDEPEEGPRLTSDRLALVLTVELAAMVKEWQAGTGEPRERWQQLRELLHELAVLRRADHRAIRNEMAQEKLAREAEALEEQQQQEWQAAHNEKIEALVRKLTHTLLNGGVSPHKVLLIESEAREAFGAGKPLPPWVEELIEKEAAQTRGSKAENPAAGRGKNPKTEGRNRWNNTSAARSAGSKEVRRPKSESRIQKKPARRTGAKANGRTPPAERKASRPNQGESKPIKPDQAINDGTDRADGTNKTSLEANAQAVQSQKEAPNQAESNPIKGKMGEAFPDANALGS